MSIKVRIKPGIKILAPIKKAMSERVAEQIGSEVVALSKMAISKGLSPVRGFGRFAKYATVRNGDPRGYPRGVRGKDISPVNLKLRGKMLNHLTNWVERKRGGSITKVGFKKSAPKDVIDIARAHNNGLKKRGIPQRKFVPTKKDEEYIVTIMRRIKQILVDRINQIGKRGT